MEMLDVVSAQLKIVRGDLRELKRCQLRYFSLSITGTGAILGFVASQRELIFQQHQASNLAALALLAPITIILPCWLIFFDKATSITRLVGFQRILERILIGRAATLRVVGLECALAEMREKEHWLDTQIRVSNDAAPPLLHLAILRIRNRYWMINWYTYAFLSGASCTLAYDFLGIGDYHLDFPFQIRLIVPERTLWGGGAFFVYFVVLVFTLVLLLRLTRGNLSYAAYAEKWDRLLNLEFAAAANVSVE